MLCPMSEAANTVPVTILTGFLGSGKTTVLNHLLRQPSLADTVVIVNEFGAVGLDHLLIEQAIEDAVLLKNGCICCTVRGDIADTLEVLWQRREAGEIPPFRRIAIETTGLADPAPVAHALLAEPGARHACRLDGIVTTVDALHGAMQLERQPEARQQVAMADRILLTKTDIAEAPQIAASEAAIAALNGTAPLRRVIAGEVNAGDVFDLGPDDGRLEQWLRPLETGGHHGHRHLPFRHGEQISARWCCATTGRSPGHYCNTGGVGPVAARRCGAAAEGDRMATRRDATARAAGRASPGASAGHSRPRRAARRRHAHVLITRGLAAAGLRASFATALGRG